MIHYFPSQEQENLKVKFTVLEIKCEIIKGNYMYII